MPPVPMAKHTIRANRPGFATPNQRSNTAVLLRTETDPGAIREGGLPQRVCGAPPSGGRLPRCCSWSPSTLKSLSISANGEWTIWPRGNRLIAGRQLELGLVSDDTGRRVEQPRLAPAGQ
jgi:hypothetical protein